MQSMTGFGGRELEVAPFGKIAVELRSANHKFLEIVFHLPEGFLSLEERVRKEIEAKIKRGRITCVITIIGTKNSSIFINKALLKNYILSLESIRAQFHLKDELSINTLIQLPGVLSLEENKMSNLNIWPRLKVLVSRVVNDLLETRLKEGRALHRYLKNRAEALSVSLNIAKARYKKAVKEKLEQKSSDEERACFLKDSDITEEIERLTYHIRNFKHKLSKAGSIGKELDFIAQEMQREANTLAAKSFDVAISAVVVQMKSQIEKVREQVQNIE